ncbi:N-formylglutamate amidohydrolase [Cognatishimia sp. F0-27]|uniref:N-formylglutamate amidohydrolase n=1 Tax=Cognatishimia sp. F0-27 TaxID=2816855 RepID=UPI001D0C3174|nr:N-formylglutamate amidohydrolase [Cognatishimia sp. F0-27]MCC1491435.1 N-formylglutamate amidohydrolase [Cognatishimia sp. F0-27]
MTYVPFTTIGADRQSPWLITCDHATNTVPPDLGGSLGLHPSDMARHIAYDVGAFGVARALGEALGAPVIASNFSRLVIDPNRGEDDPTLIMKLYDGSVIPGNRAVDAAERERRLAAYYRPYDEALAALAGRREDVAIVSVHSFTQQLRGRPARPWHIGILHAEDRRLSDPLIARIAEEPTLCVGRNAPYPGHLPGDAVDRHARQRGRHNTLIEIRNDLIEDRAGQSWWGEHLALWLTDARARMKPDAPAPILESKPA